MKVFTPEQMNHQDIDRGFISPFVGSPTSSYGTCNTCDPSESHSDFFIILLVLVLILFDTPPKLFTPNTDCK